jgi:hypothetical protein
VPETACGSNFAYQCSKKDFTTGPQRPAMITITLREYQTMANQLGKRYLCEKCGTEVLCNKPGTGAIECCDVEMKIKEAKALPSSD